jgi:hypothetical protein
MIKNYILVHPDIDGEVSFTFQGGYLYAFKINAFNVPEATIRGLLSKLPLISSEIGQVSSNPLAKITEVKQEIEFSEFWDAYAYKVGNKARAEKIWNGMSILDKQMALAYIPKYNRFLAEKGTARLYPETYLSQSRYK